MKKLMPGPGVEENLFPGIDDFHRPTGFHGQEACAHFQRRRFTFGTKTTADTGSHNPNLTNRDAGHHGYGPLHVMGNLS